MKKLNEKVKQGVDILKESKKQKTKKPKIKKIKSFDEYFQECIENKEFHADTPPYFREALILRELLRIIIKDL